MNSEVLRFFDSSRAPAAARDRRPDFRKLLGDAAWGRLPAAVRARFDRDAHRVATAYLGEADVKASRGGRWFAQLCRLVGTPVAPFVGEDVPMRVNVFDSPQGVVWER